MTEKTYTEKSFWQLYDEYAKESFSRHSRSFYNLFDTYSKHTYSTVVDLGCGHSKICKTILNPHHYYGFDKNPKGEKDDFELDFSDFDKVINTIKELKPQLVTAWFSVDVVLPFEKSNLLWKKILKETDVKKVFTTGFYYDNEKRNQEKISEVDGGLISYQTPKGFYFPAESGISETRLEKRAPSKLFGKDPIEVYRLLEKTK